jgi:hypothetical protein
VITAITVDLCRGREGGFFSDGEIGLPRLKQTLFSQSMGSANFRSTAIEASPGVNQKAAGS